MNLGDTTKLNGFSAVQFMTSIGTVLLIDDNEDDLLLIGRAFRTSGFDVPITTISTGEEALEFFKGTGIYADRTKFPIPRLVLLDLKMPRMDGFEILTWLRRQPEWKALPVVVLTTSF